MLTCLILCVLLPLCAFSHESKKKRDEHQKSSIRIGTADLLDMLTADEPNVDFTWALGADTFIDLASGKWRRTEDVFQMVGYRMVVFRRLQENHDGCINKNEQQQNGSEDLDRKLQESIAKWQLINSTQSSIRVVQIPTLSNVSSSAVRRSSDVALLKEMVSSDVLDYMQQHRMYSLSETNNE